MKTDAEVFVLMVKHPNPVTRAVYRYIYVQRMKGKRTL